MGYFNKIDSWLAALKAGEVVIAPAEGMYGYCCNPFHEGALAKLMALKQRSPNKGLIVLIPDISHLASLCPTPLPESCQSALQTHWGASTNPQPTTLILPALPKLPKLLTGEHTTLAIRKPHSPYMREYLEAWGGPLVSTSCNLAGEPPATLANQLPVSIPALALPEALGGNPSRVYDARKGIWLR